MEFIAQNNRSYGYISNYKDNKQLRDSFNSLTRHVYGFDFESWFQSGYWQEKYIPYSLIDGDNIVANVSVNIIDFDILGVKKSYIQLGTVMTADAYRHQGLSRYLMERIILEWENNCDMIYLFANDTVLEFYTKFGFKKAKEYQYSKAIIKKDYELPISRLPASKLAVNELTVSKLNMDHDIDIKLLYNKARSSLPQAKLSMLNNADLIMFYALTFMKDNVYYIEDLDTVVIAEFDEVTLHILDIFSSKKYILEDIIKSLITDQTQKIVLGFTQQDAHSYDLSLLQEEDTTLFIKTKELDILDTIKNEKLMFPLLSHA